MTILIDASSPAVVTSSTNVATSASFSPPDGSVITAKCCIGNSSGSGSVTGAVTDSLGGSWTMLDRYNVTNEGCVELWAINAGPNPAARTVTLTGTVTIGKGVILDVDVLTGSKLTAALLGASTHGATATVSVTVGVAGSFVFSALMDNATTGSYTAAANNTLDQSFNDASNGERSATAHSTTTQPTGAFTAGFVGAVSQAVTAGWEILDGGPRTQRVANQTVLGASKVSAAFTVPVGDKIVVSAAAGDESGDGVFDITISDSVGLSWTETTIVNTSSNDAAVSMFEAVSTGVSMTVTVAATGATAIGFRVDSVVGWSSVTNRVTGTSNYGVTSTAVTYSPAPATDSLCMACAHRMQPAYDHGTGLLDTPAGWTLVEFIEFQHAVDRWLQFKIYERTGSASTSAGTTHGTESDSVTAAAIEITFAAVVAGYLLQQGGGKLLIQGSTDALIGQGGVPIDEVVPRSLNISQATQRSAVR